MMHQNVGFWQLRDLPDDIRDLFDISYERPGRMCPGLTCAIEIIFTPRVRADIRSELCLLTETGPISIPLVCTYPRVVPSLDISKVRHLNGRVLDQTQGPYQLRHWSLTRCARAGRDTQARNNCLTSTLILQVIFDYVVKGEKAFFNLTIRNDGALPTAYTITPRDAAADVKHSATVPEAAPQSPMSGESYLEEKAKEGETAVSGKHSDLPSRQDLVLGSLMRHTDVSLQVQGIVLKGLAQSASWLSSPHGRGWNG